jgi:hypothetical protein
MFWAFELSFVVDNLAFFGPETFWATFWAIFWDTFWATFWATFGLFLKNWIIFFQIFWSPCWVWPSSTHRDPICRTHYQASNLADYADCHSTECRHAERHGTLFGTILLQSILRKIHIIARFSAWLAITLYIYQCHSIIPQPIRKLY